MDISAGITALQEASAEAVVHVSLPETIQAILGNRVPTGNVFETARVAGLFALKNTHLNLPNSYPILIEFAHIEFSITDLEVKIFVKVKSISRLNLEIESMHCAAIAALTIYDMLKPIDGGISIQEIKVLEKHARSFGQLSSQPFDVAVVVCSNAVAKGIKSDTAGQLILEKLASQCGNVTSYDIIPDDVDQIRTYAKRLSSQNQLLIFSGGTGLSKTDVTTDVLEQLLERRIPGVEEAMRSYGQKLTPYAMFSRSLAGMMGNCLVLALPGSTRGAKESIDAVFPGILHAFPIMKRG